MEGETSDGFQVWYGLEFCGDRADLQPGQAAAEGGTNEHSTVSVDTLIAGESWVTETALGTSIHEARAESSLQAYAGGYVLVSGHVYNSSRDVHCVIESFRGLHTEVVRSIVEAVQESVSPFVRASLDSVFSKEPFLLLRFSNWLGVCSRLFSSSLLNDWLIDNWLLLNFLDFVGFRHLK